MDTTVEPDVATVTRYCLNLRRLVRGQEYKVICLGVPEKRAMSSKGGWYWGVVEVPRVYFWKNGVAEHNVAATSLERVEAHWQGFLCIHKAWAPKVGGFAWVKTGPSREYRAKVLKVTKSRIQAQWTYRNGNRSAPRWFKLSEVAWN